MFCTNCGSPRPAGAMSCPKCGTPAPNLAPTQPIQNYLVQAILVTVCCCMPAGVAAIIYAAQVNTKLAAGDIAGAQESARLAKRWSWVGLAAGIAVGVLYAIVGILGAIADSQ